jgi:glucosylceramidase
MITVDNTNGTYTRNGEYYAWEHLSKVVAPECTGGSWATNAASNLVWELQNNLIGPLRNSGAARIASTDLGNGSIQTVGFKNPDGSLALITLNSNTTHPITFQVSWGGQSFTYTLPAGSVASFKWTPGVVASYNISNQASGSCIDAAGWGTTNGTIVQQWTCGSQQYNQEWQLLPTSGGYYKILNRNAAAQNLVWDVTGGSGATADGAKIQLWAYTGGTNQQWKSVSLGNGYYKFVARNSGKCLDVPGASGANGVQLQQWSCNNAPSQAFSLAEQP